MDIDFAFICDYAEVAGKINALGIGFDTIYAPEVPVTHPMFWVVAQLRASITEAGEKGFSFNLIDADGADVIPPLSGSFNIPRPSSGTETKGRLGIAIQGVRFQRYGDYSLHLVVEGREMVRVPLKVAPRPSAG